MKPWITRETQSTLDEYGPRSLLVIDGIMRAGA